jgi:hypothetical protein
LEPTSYDKQPATDSWIGIAKLNLFLGFLAASYQLNCADYIVLAFSMEIICTFGAFWLRPVCSFTCDRMAEEEALKQGFFPEHQKLQ